MRQQYIDAVCQEMELRHDEQSSIDTIYLGGGTPSQLTMAQLEQLFIYINKVYQRTDSCEVTIEMNPDDVTTAYAETLVQLGVNRVSMGAQTFDNPRLQFLHRRHTAEQVSLAVKTLRMAGIQNISIDLMYGFPGETMDDWQHDIDAALALDVEHISAYCLTVEEGTELERMLHKQEKSFRIDITPVTLNEPFSICDEETERAMYELLIDRLTAAGYEHYEISNFARPGFRSRHNSNYWRDIPYIGLGAAAHSYDGRCRSWNVSNLRTYIEAINHGERPCDSERVDGDTWYNDRITVALRTREGLDLSTLSDHHRRYCLKEARPFIADGLLQLTDDHLTLTRKGLFVSDYVMSSLVMV